MSASAPTPRQKESPTSFLYECRVLHHRREPREHRFEYGIFMICVDLDELEPLNRSLRLFGHNRRNLYEFRDSDHLVFPSDTKPASLKESILRWLEQEGFPIPADSRIQLITLPRVFGYVFNPVSFYFCRSAEGEPLCAVAEVGNTFGEMKPYRIPLEDGSRGRCRRIVPKHFYVSPFSSLQLSFDFDFRWPGDQLRIRINDVTEDGRTVLISNLTGERRPLTDGQLLRMTARYPLVTLRVITLIHWHALRLWWKRMPWHRKADRTDLQLGIFRPHASLAGSGGGPAPTPLHQSPPPALRQPLSEP